MQSTPERGFTFVELMLVLMIMGVVAALAVPRFSGLIQNYKLANAARVVWLDLHRARMRAIKQGVTMRVDFRATSYTIKRVDTSVVVFSRQLSGDYPGISVSLNGTSQSVSFGSTGTADNRTVVIQGPTRSKSFTVITTGRLGAIS